MPQKSPAVYILSSPNKKTVYIGVTGNLLQRVYRHKTRQDGDSFSSRYNTVLLVYYEHLQTMREAISREKQLKGWSREKKNRLIETKNPGWEDLYSEIRPFEANRNVQVN